MRSKLLTLVLVLTSVALVGSALAQDPIAHYPLVSDAADATGNYGDMILEDCPFQDGGVYCNGDFWGFTCETPLLDGLTLDLFTITAEFKIENYHTVNMPVIWIGLYWRNLGFEISPEGYAGIAVAASEFYASDVMVTLGEWHTARISWNEDQGVGSCYLDGELIMVAERGPFSASSDKRVVPKNGSFGRALEGILRQLYIYNTDELDPVAIEDTTWGAVKSLYR